MSTVVPISSEVATTRACADVTRPCPFCGQIDKIEVCDDEGYDDNDVYVTVYYVDCARCGCEGPKADSPALAAASWNHRTV
jgi:Lar family restriction alleviation protein